MNFTVSRAPAQWKQLLGTQRYAILREAATERAFSSPLLNEHRKGTFVCAGCALPLFSSATKFESGTGWPSFWKPLPNAVVTRADNSLMMETNGSPVRALRRASRARFRRRSETDRTALLHERAGPELQASLSGRLGDDPQFPALAGRGIANDAKFGLEPLELALLRLFRGFGVALLDLGFLLGLLAEEGDGDPVPEDLVAAKSQLGIGSVRKAVTHLSQFVDEFVERHMVGNIDEIL